MKTLNTSIAIFFITLSTFSLAADRFDPQLSPIGSIAPLETSAKQIDASIKIYRPWFENLSWQGDLIEYYIKDNKYLETTVNLDGITPQAMSGADDNWSALSNLSKKGSTWWDAGRKVIFLKGNAQKAFRFNNLTAAQQASLSNDMTNYIRGDQSKEFSQGGSYRDRHSILGSIINSNPSYVIPPAEWIEDQDYVDFIKKHKERASEIVVGANDGMVHIFDAKTGEENYAYVPSMVIDNLHKLTLVDYVHQYYVDGKIIVKDAKVGSDYATVAVGGLGGGGKGLWALDVTYPTLANETYNSGKNKKVLWELKDDADLGNIYGRPNIVRLMESNGTPKDYVVVGNGFNSDNGHAMLYIIDIANGKVEKKITVSSGTNANPNGLSMPALIDTTGDGIIDYGYAGTINGEVYKFYFGEGETNWINSGKIFVTHEGDKTPITTVPQVAKHPEDGFLVTFATGRLFTEADITDKTTQWVYGIWDKNETDANDKPKVTLINHNDLNEQKISKIKVSGEDSYSLTNKKIDWTSKLGWRVALWGGARVITDPGLRNKRMKFTITEPENIKNWDAEISYDNGGGAEEAVIDKNADGVVNNGDKSSGKIPMVFGRPDGIRSGPKFLRLNGGLDAIIHNNLKLAVFTEVEDPEPVPTPGPGPGPEICTTCASGLTGGHFDADSYDSDFKSGSTEHEHEYDDKNSTNHLSFTNAKSIKSFSPSSSEKYIIVMANADLSPGGMLTIGKESWNALDYQTTIHDKLLDWDGKNTSDLKDDYGRPLVFSRDDIVCSGCTLGVTFEVNGLAMGGLIPSQTGCVKDSDDWGHRHGRRRDGALLTYVVKLESGKNPLKDLEEQDPKYIVDKAVITFNGEVKQINLAKSLNGKEDFGGLIPKKNSPYSTSLFWHYSGSCYDDYNSWKQDRADAVNGLYTCTGGGGKGGKKGDTGDTGGDCTSGTTGNAELDDLLKQLRLAGILATNYTNALTNAWAFCADDKNKSHSHYNKICVGTNSIVARLEALLPPGGGVGGTEPGTGGGGGGGGTETSEELNSTLTPITKSKVEVLPYGRKAWVNK